MKQAWTKPELHEVSLNAECTAYAGAVGDEPPSPASDGPQSAERAADSQAPGDRPGG